MADTFTIANSSQPIEFDGKHEAASAALALVKSAQREICFMGSQLDAALFDHVAVIDAMKQFCLRNHRTQIRILLDETRSSMLNSHRLLQLISMLTSSIHVHILSVQHQHPKNLVMLSDNSGYLRCLNNQRYYGQADLHDPLMVKALRQQFDEYWNHSTADVATRRLHL